MSHGFDAKEDETQEVLRELVEEYGIEYKRLTPYQIRVNGAFDIYPVNQKFHNIKTGERGGYTHLLPLILQHLGLNFVVCCPKCKHNFFHSLK